VLENRVLRRVFGPKTDEVTGEWRRLHSEEIYDTCSSSNIIWLTQNKKDGMGGACGTYGEIIGAYRVLVGKPEGKKQLESPRCKWEDNTGMDLQEIA
jgi:hypothetical protein